LKSSPIDAFGDRNMIATIIRNLVSNAIKFTNPNGAIDVSLRKEGQNVEIAVKDSGVGISAENIEKIFNFNEYYNTRGTKNERGTGLGLILCKEFATQNGGDISIESTVGVGTTITVTIPAVVE
jgi:signal transduction histidine kinase